MVHQMAIRCMGWSEHGSGRWTGSIRTKMVGWKILQCIVHRNNIFVGYVNTVAGGVTTALILPGSADAIGEASHCPRHAKLKLMKTRSFRGAGICYQVKTYKRALADVHASGATVRLERLEY